MKKSTLISQPAEKLWYIGYHDIEKSSWRAVTEPVLVHRAVAAGGHHLAEVQGGSDEVRVAIDVAHLLHNRGRLV